jgi:hypothetical protein
MDSKNCEFRMNFFRRTRHLILYFCISAAFTACATSDFLKTTDGDVVADHENEKHTELPTVYTASFERVSSDSNPTIQVTIKKNSPIKYEWTKTFSQKDIYETRCRGWKNGRGQFFNSNGNTGFSADYCELNTGEFVIEHLLAFGFLYDLTIPFQSYESKDIETTVSTKQTRSESSSRIDDNYTPITDPKVRFEMNGIEKFITLKDGVGSFKARDFKLPRDLSVENSVFAIVSGEKIDVTDSYGAVVSAQRKETEDAEVEAAKPENRFKMNFCEHPDLFSAVYETQTVTLEANCIYRLGNQPLKIIQVVRGGVLAGLRDGLFGYLPNRTIFIKTKTQHADDDLLFSINLKSVGTTSYTTVMGGSKTVYSFEELQ